MDEVDRLFLPFHFNVIGDRRVLFTSRVRSDA
jgi:hypothetical protein